MKRNIFIFLSLLTVAMSAWGSITWTDSISKLQYTVTNGYAVVSSGVNDTATVVTIPDAIMADDGKVYNVLAIGDGAFKGNTKIQRISKVGKVATIGRNAFENCTSLNRMLLSSSNALTIQSEAFKNCTGLERVGLTSPMTVEGSAFDGCSSVKIVTLNARVTVNANAFKGCTGIENIYVAYSEKPSVQNVDDNAFEETVKTTATVTQVGSYNANVIAPWNSFTKTQSLACGEYTLDRQSGLSTVQKNRVTMPMSGNDGKVFMVNLPFKVSSYYFGPDAKVYEMKSIAGVSAIGGTNLLYLNKVNIDSIMTLPVSTPLLIKCSHSIADIKGTYDLFKEKQVSVNPVAYSQAIYDESTKTTYGTISSNTESKSVWQSGDNATYVLDNGFLKRVNSSEYTVPACGVIITNSDSYANSSVSLATYEKGVSDSTSLVVSHATVQPLTALNNYVSFYNETSDFEICEEENGNPKAKVYTVMKTTSGTTEALQLHEVKDGIIQKGCAVLINASTEDKDLKLRMVTNGSTDAEAYNGNILKGVTADTPVSELCGSGEEYIYTLGRNNDQLAVAFQQYGKANTLNAYRAYIPASVLSGSQSYYPLPDAATGIFQIETVEQGLENAAIYNISGQRTSDLQKGQINIINNKKVIVK